MGYSWGDDTAANWGGSATTGAFNYGKAEAGYNTNDGKTYVNPETGAQLSANMGDAYKLSKKIMASALKPEEIELLKRLKPEDITVSQGRYDKAELVLTAAGTPYQMSSMELRPKQMLLINCPGGNLEQYTYQGQRGVKALNKFIEDGGYLVTTDWALETVIQSAFPGFIQRGSTNTKDDLVEVSLVAAGSPYTEGLGRGSLKPVWWLENASYPIKLLNERNIDVLLASDEMRRLYQEPAIAVKFQIGEGRVIHVTSHFYLQTVKTKYEAQAKKSGLDFATKFIGIAQDEAETIKDLDKIVFGALESAYTSMRFVHNIILHQLKSKYHPQGLIAEKPIEVIGQLGAKSVAIPLIGRKPSTRLLIPKKGE
jgi:hypothetical protein